MSQFVGFKCDVCGALFDTGIRMSGDKKAEIQCGKVRRGYRFDLCNKCYDDLMEFSAIRQTKGKRLLASALKCIDSIKDIVNTNNLDNQDRIRLINNTVVAFSNDKINIYEME